MDYDVAVMKTVSQIKFSSTIKSIPLALLRVPVGTQLFVTGWGRTATVSPFPNKLQGVNVAMISTADCVKAYGLFITPRKICASALGKDTCNVRKF